MQPKINKFFKNPKNQKIASDSQDVEKLQSLCTAAGNVKWCSYCGKQYGSSSRRLNTELPCDPAIPLLGISPKELKQGLKQLKQQCSKSSLIHNSLKAETTKMSMIVEWIEQTVVHTYNGILFSQG